MRPCAVLRFDVHVFMCAGGRVERHRLCRTSVHEVCDLQVTALAVAVG